MSLVADVRVHLGTLDLEVALTAQQGETIALLGPNGAGKTTLLRALSGLAPIDSGRIELDGTLLDDGLRTFVPPERRPVAVVFQDYLLFPHLSALDNVAFGLRTRGLGRMAARARAMSALEQVDLAEHAGSKPKALSGGQAQRVALARALATEPVLLLLDEPLAALDQSARGAVRRELRARLATFRGLRLLVTHDPLDAAVLADRLVIIEEGHVVQRGTFAEVAARPRSRYVAELVGVNLLRGTAHGGLLDLPGGGTLAASDAASGNALAVVHPRSVALHRARPEGSPRNVNEGPVESIELLGDRVRVRVGGRVPLVAEITPSALRELQLAEGALVWTSVKATDIDVYAA
ncbi:MAG TPA: ABC transporter ATP-binding protein [Acidimicrobiia bacterium]|jgi:molybdate transport system ATP-binding protein